MAVCVQEDKGKGRVGVLIRCGELGKWGMR